MDANRTRQGTDRAGSSRPYAFVGGLVVTGMAPARPASPAPTRPLPAHVESRRLARPSGRAGASRLEAHSLVDEKYERSNSYWDSGSGSDSYSTADPKKTDWQQTRGSSGSSSKKDNKRNNGDDDEDDNDHGKPQTAKRRFISYDEPEYTFSRAQTERLEGRAPAKRPKRKSQYEFLKPWGGWYRFMLSYGLKPHVDDDVEEGRHIMESMMNEEEDD